MNSILIFLMFAAAVLGIFWFLARRKTKSLRPPVTRVEFWVYSPTEQRPTDKQIMERLVSDNPHHKRGLPPIGAAEGLTFSDVRFHIGVVKRAKNAMLFHPEIVSELDAEIPSDLPQILEDSVSVFIVRFVADGREKNLGYLQFCVYVADTIASVTNSKLIWDTESQTFIFPKELSAALDDNPDATRFELQVVTHWTETPFEGRAFTRGMAKAGIPDVEFAGSPLDQKVLAMFLVEESARRLWQASSVEPVAFSGYGEEFEVDFSQARPGLPSHRGWLTTLHAVRKRAAGA